MIHWTLDREEMINEGYSIRAEADAWLDVMICKETTGFRFEDHLERLEND